MWCQLMPFPIQLTFVAVWVHFVAWKDNVEEQIGPDKAFLVGPNGVHKPAFDAVTDVQCNGPRWNPFELAKQEEEAALGTPHGWRKKATRQVCPSHCHSATSPVPLEHVAHVVQWPDLSHGNRCKLQLFPWFAWAFFSTVWSNSLHSAEIDGGCTRSLTTREKRRQTRKTSAHACLGMALFWTCTACHNWMNV